MAQFVEPPVWVLHDPDQDQVYIDPETNKPFWHHHSQVTELMRRHVGNVWEVRQMADLLTFAAPWDHDIVAELARNDGPYENANLQRDGGWWSRTLDQIDGVTIHHTCSDSPHATARYCVNSKGIPSIQYNIWITQTGEVLKCVNLTEGLWHDNTGHRNTHLSIGMAGTLHLYRPAEIQMATTASVCRWAIKTLLSVEGINQIKGHQDYFGTQCPGWDMRKGNEGSGHWKDDFYRILEGLLLSF